MNDKEINKESIRIFDVVINHQQQHSILADDKVLPNGWTYAGFKSSKDDCLSYISEHWLDLTPKSVNSHLSI